MSTLSELRTYIADQGRLHDACDYFNNEIVYHDGMKDGLVTAQLCLQNGVAALIKDLQARIDFCASMEDGSWQEEFYSMRHAYETSLEFVRKHIGI